MDLQFEEKGKARDFLLKQGVKSACANINI
jgi:hypothetical protein